MARDIELFSQRTRVLLKFEANFGRFDVNDGNNPVKYLARGARFFSPVKRMRRNGEGKLITRVIGISISSVISGTKTRYKIGSTRDSAR